MINLSNNNFYSLSQDNFNFHYQPKCAQPLQNNTVENVLIKSWSDTPSVEYKRCDTYFFYTSSSCALGFDTEQQSTLIENVKKDLIQRQMEEDNELDCVFAYLAEEQLSPKGKERAIDYLKQFDKFFNLEDENVSLNVETSSAELEVFVETPLPPSFSTVESEAVNLQVEEASHILAAIEEKLSTKKNKRAAKQKEKMERLEAEAKQKAELLQIAAKAKEEQQKAEEEKKQRGFDLQILGKDSFLIVNNARPQVEDRTKIGEDFRTKHTSVEIGLKHMLKRMSFFFVMCNYVSEKAKFLQNYSLPMYQKNQFAVNLYAVPSSYKQSKSEDWERTHISLLSKIVTQHVQTHELFKIVGHLTVKNMQGSKLVKTIETNLEAFFNICDIAPRIVNAIDWYAEYWLRAQAYQYLDDIRTGKLDATIATILLAKDYVNCLEDLYDRIEDNDNRPPKQCLLKKDFHEKMDLILSDRMAALKYIDGMQSALNLFIQQLEGKADHSSLNFYA